MLYLGFFDVFVCLAISTGRTIAPLKELAIEVAHILESAVVAYLCDTHVAIYQQSDGMSYAFVYNVV